MDGDYATDDYEALTMSCALLGPALLMWLVTTTPQQAAVSRPPVYTIDGKEHPELIPLEVAWEAAFNALWTSASTDKTQSPADVLKGLSKYELHIPPADVQRVLNVARRTVDRLKTLRAPFEDEHATGREMKVTPEARQLRLQQIGETIVDGRDELVRTLSKESFNRLRRWVLRSIVPGIKVDLYDKQTR